MITVMTTAPSRVYDDEKFFEAVVFWKGILSKWYGITPDDTRHTVPAPCVPLDGAVWRS